MADLAGDLSVSTDDRLDQAEARVRAYCDWHIAPVVTNAVFVQSFNAPALFLPSLNVRSIVSITDDDATTYTTADYAFTSWGQLTRAGDWCGYWWKTGTTVTFEHGYDSPPPEVTAVVQALAQRALDNPGSLVRTQDGPFSDTYSQTSAGAVVPMALLPDEKAALAPYRIVPM